MAEIQITTTQNVTLDFKAAELNHRILAWLIDVLIKSAYITLISLLVYKLLGLESYINSLDRWSQWSVSIVIGLPVTFYTLFFETVLGGQTLGKKAMKIKVLKLDGYQSSFLDYFIRWVMRIVDIYASLSFVALISIGSTKKAQRIGGMASGTAVVSLRNKINISHTILDENLKSNYQPVYPSVIKLSDNDVRIIKENFVKAKRKNDQVLLNKLKNKICGVIDVQLNEEHHTERFIETILKDYNHFTQSMT
ncbi:RDD family protein [Ochrovirga pacifica]|uniref:RDD family protein n=1 Tax=Ochrovirga pacifica TaxID=1042376 RepID=UPI0002559B1D|nr:RDD family protein [Ochrovirga pacifica]